MEVTKVLWPTDFSSTAEKALPYVTDLTQKYGVDLVVMASHGQKGNYRFGSVTEKVIKNSPVPVTTIPVEPE